MDSGPGTAATHANSATRITCSCPDCVGALCSRRLIDVSTFFPRESCSLFSPYLAVTYLCLFLFLTAYLSIYICKFIYYPAQRSVYAELLKVRLTALALSCPPGSRLLQNEICQVSRYPVSCLFML